MMSVFLSALFVLGQAPVHLTSPQAGPCLSFVPFNCTLGTLSAHTLRSLVPGGFL